MLKAARLITESSSSEARREGSDDDAEDTVNEFDDSSEYYDEICFETEWHGCYAHGLQLCIRDAFKVDSASKLMKKVKTVVNTIRRSTLNMDVLDDEGNNVYNSTEVRWNSELRMISSLLKIGEDVLDKIVPPEHILTKEERKYLNELVLILTPFEESTDESQRQNDVSISAVLPSARGIKYGLRVMWMPVASDFQAALLESFLDRFDWIQSSSLFACAAILDPRYGLRWTESEAESESWINVLEAETKRFRDSHSFSPSVIETPPPAVPQRGVFSFFRESRVPFRDGVRREIEDYLMAIPYHTGGCLDFWKKAHAYPNLSQFAMALLSTPASSAAVERLFSVAGKIIRPDRSRLDPDGLERLLFLKSNWDLV